MIQKEIEDVDCTDFRALSRLSHLTGTIYESMRLLPSVPTFGSRLVRPAGLTVGGIFIPGGTKICAPRYSLGRCKSQLPFPLLSQADE